MTFFLWASDREWYKNKQTVLKVFTIAKQKGVLVQKTKGANWQKCKMTLEPGVFYVKLSWIH